MRSLALAVIISFFTTSSAVALPAIAAQAATAGQEAATWRKVADAIPLGTTVKVQRIDGSRVSGTLMRTDDTSVTIKKSTRLPEPPVSITYDQVANIERDRKGAMGWGKAIGFGVAAGAGAILTILAIALQLD